LNVTDVPVPSGGSAARARARRGGRWRKLLIALAVAFFFLCTVTARLFVWPDQGMPPSVDAIVMLDSPGYPLDFTLRVAAEHRARFLVISQGIPVARDPCPARVPGVTLICFHPSPPTTRGEAEYIGRLAEKYHWRSIAVVAITPQATRARLRVERCFPGRVYMVAAPIRPGIWPYQIAYEWGALVKALVVERSC
jgi:hypothetical protein